MSNVLEFKTKNEEIVLKHLKEIPHSDNAFREVTRVASVLGIEIEEVKRIFEVLANKKVIRLKRKYKCLECGYREILTDKEVKEYLNCLNSNEYFLCNECSSEVYIDNKLNENTIYCDFI